MITLEKIGAEAAKNLWVKIRAKAGGFRSPVGSPRLSGRPYTILGLTQHSSALNAYCPGRRQTAPTLSGVLATQDSRGFFVLASPSAEVTPLPIPEEIRLRI